MDNQVDKWSKKIKMKVTIDSYFGEYFLGIAEVLVIGESDLVAEQFKWSVGQNLRFCSPSVSCSTEFGSHEMLPAFMTVI